MSKQKVYIDPKVWGSNAESVATQAATQFPNARFAIGADGLNTSDEAKQIASNVKTMFGAKTSSAPESP